MLLRQEGKIKDLYDGMPWAQIARRPLIRRKPRRNLIFLPMLQNAGSPRTSLSQQEDAPFRQQMLPPYILFTIASVLYRPADFPFA